VQKDTQRLSWIIGLTGLGLIATGFAAYYRQRQVLSGLGRHGYRQAPVVGSYSDGEMRTTLRQSRDMPIEERIATIQELIEKSIQDPQMRKLALQITARCPERDGECEARAIYDYVKRNVRYTGDVAPIKWRSGEIEGVDLYQSARRTTEFRGGDCLPISTLVMRDDYQLVPLAEIDAGDRIMGDGQWAEVQDRWLTGEKELLAFELSNGCVLRCTPEHRIFRDVDGRLEEIRASEARVGDDLVTPKAFKVSGRDGHEWPEHVRSALTPEDLGWLLGVYVADGWADGKNTKAGWHPYRAGISGADGKPKEEQKRRVQALMALCGIDTRWHEKYIAINDSSLARFFAEVGTGAPNKRLVSLEQVDQAQLQALLLGLSADADQRNNVHGTTSPTLALQLRVLYRMLGQSTHIRRVDDHGGLGKHPIYRVTPRALDNNRRDIRFARIRSISDGGVELCTDLTTSTGNLWLPESDALVHNCDDHSILNGTLLALNGITPVLRVVRQRGDNDWTHIYAGGLMPKGGGNKFMALDTTLPGNNRFGVEVPIAKYRDFPA